MNTTAILIAAHDIDKNTAALKWLEEYGVQLGTAEYARAEMRFDSLFASSCLGADEAKAALERTAGLFIQEIVRTATSRCRMNIDLARKKITDEVAKAVVATPREEASDVEA